MIRQEVIKAIIADDEHTILNGGEDGLVYLTELLTYGSQGWNNQTNEDLEIEYIQRFSPAYPDEFKIQN